MAKNGLCTQRTKTRGQRFKNITHVVLLPFVVSYRCSQTLCGSLGSNIWIENGIKTMHLELLISSVQGAQVSPSWIFMAKKIHRCPNQCTSEIYGTGRHSERPDPVHFLWSKVRHSTLAWWLFQVCCWFLTYSTVTHICSFTCSGINKNKRYESIQSSHVRQMVMHKYSSGCRTVQLL